MYSAVSQSLTILVLFLAGYIIINGALKDFNPIFNALLAFPFGLAMFAVSGLVVLIANIKYTINSVMAAFIIIWVIFMLIVKVSFNDVLKLFVSKFSLAVLVVAIIVSIFSVSGIIPLSLSNDSIYYYSLYPQTLVIDGGYMLSHDVFLTDVGQSVAVINTLPFMLGYHESFGIQTALLISFFGVFIYFCYERFEIDSSKYIKITILSCVLLLVITCTPFLVISEWVLANCYFMDYMFLVFALSYYYMKHKIKELLYIIALFILFLSMARMEGLIMLGVLLLSISVEDIKNSDLVKYYIFPSLIFVIPYYVILYFKIGVNPLYSFLDIKKALLQAGFMIVVGFYFAFIRGRYFMFFQRDRFAYSLMGALAGINLLLLVYNHEKYLNNMVSFFKNIIMGNGWGYFGFFIILMAILLPYKKIDNANKLFCVSYVLVCMAVLFARDGGLRIGTGDSGNRVLLQIIPFVLYTLFEEIAGEFKHEK